MNITSSLASVMNSGMAMTMPLISEILMSKPSIVAVWCMSDGLSIIMAPHIQLGMAPDIMSSMAPPEARCIPNITEPIVSTDGYLYRRISSARRVISG